MSDSSSSSDTPPQPRSNMARAAVHSIQAAMARHRGNVDAVDRVCAHHKEEFPTLYRLLTSGEAYPPEVLEMLLRAVEKVERGTVTEHDASVAVGTLLVDRYVKPAVTPPPRQRTNSGHPSK